MSEDYKPIGAEPLPEEQPDERGSIQRAADDFKSIPRRSPVARNVAQAIEKRAAAAGWTKTASFFAAFGPELIAVILTVIFVVIVGLVSLYLLTCTGQSCQGTRPIDGIQPANNKQDALNLKDIICLNTAIQKNADGTGKLPKECVEPIQARAKLIIANATAIKGKITPDEEGGKAAIQILDDLIAAAKKAEAVKANMSIKEVQEIREEITKQSELASANALILKQRGFTPNAQIIINYVKAQPFRTDQPSKRTCSQSTGSNCGVTADGIVTSNFPGASHSDYFALGGLVEDIPTDKNIQDVRDQLSRGHIPIWQVRGNGDHGKHFITVLGISDSNDITYFDPANGDIETHPYNWQSSAGWGPYFGTPTLEKITGNLHTRGYYWVTK